MTAGHNPLQVAGIVCMKYETHGKVRQFILQEFFSNFQAQRYKLNQFGTATKQAVSVTAKQATNHGVILINVLTSSY
jgi:hypothetical protein